MANNWVSTTLTVNNRSTELTTAAFTELATPAGPPLVLSPRSQATIATIAPKMTDLIKANNRSDTEANEAKVPV